MEPALPPFTDSPCRACPPLKQHCRHTCRKATLTASPLGQPGAYPVVAPARPKPAKKHGPRIKTTPLPKKRPSSTLIRTGRTADPKAVSKNHGVPLRVWANLPVPALQERPSRKRKMSAKLVESAEQIKKRVVQAAKPRVPLAGADLVGQRVLVRFDDGARHAGQICEYDADRDLHRIDYDDGVVEWTPVPDDGVH